MKILFGVGALALTLGMASAMPATAQDYNGVYLKDGYIDRDDGIYHRTGSMSRGELMREVEDQGYYDIGDLHPSSLGSGTWVATAHIDGELVSITIDPYNGRVLSADEI